MRTILLLASFLLSFQTALAEPKALSILHFNDFHGHLEMAQKMAGLIKKIRAENEKLGVPTIVLNGGDLISGTPYSFEKKGEIEFEFLKLIDANASVTGNHEFDFGSENLFEKVNGSGEEFVAKNIRYKGKKNGPFPPTAIVDAGGKIGIIGIAHKNTPNLTMRSNVEGLVFDDPIKVAGPAIKDLAKGSALQIALTHQGVESDIKFAKKFKDIDIVIGGHDHVPQKEYCREVAKRPVCQTPPNGEFLGKIDLKYENGRLIEYKSALLAVEKGKSDPETEKIIGSFVKNIDKRSNEVIGRAKKGIKVSRDMDSPLGSLVAKIITEYSGAEVGILNSGGVRTSLKKGPITVGDIETMLPFQNKVLMIEIKGKDLTAFAKAVEKDRKTLQTFNFDVTSLEPERLYKVATVDFVYTNAAFKEIRKGRVVFTSEPYIKDIVIEYIKKEKIL